MLFATSRRVALSAALLALLTACDGSPGAKKTGQNSRFASYAALGDSYSSAPLNPQTADAGCLRSTQNYASQFAASLSVPLTDATCAGATTDDIDGEQRLPASRGGGSVEPQIEAVDDETDLVTIGLGGNDGGLFTTLVNRCLSPRSSTASCLDGVEKTGDATDFRQAREALLGVIDQVRSRAADDVLIVVIDYPRLVSSAQPCDALPGIPRASLAEVADAQNELNVALAQAASDGGALFLDLEKVSGAHDLCSDEPWLNGSRTQPGIAQRFHPLPLEQARVAALLDQLLADVA